MAGRCLHRRSHTLLPTPIPCALICLKNKSLPGQGLSQGAAESPVSPPSKEQQCQHKTCPDWQMSNRLRSNGLTPRNEDGCWKRLEEGARRINGHQPVNKRHRSNTGWMMDQRCRRWPVIRPVFVHGLLPDGIPQCLQLGFPRNVRQGRSEGKEESRSLILQPIEKQLVGLAAERLIEDQLSYRGCKTIGAFSVRQWRFFLQTYFILQSNQFLQYIVNWFLWWAKFAHNFMRLCLFFKYF